MTSFPLLPWVAALLLMVGCRANPFDGAQVPRPSVAPGPPPLLTWKPAGARLVRVYRGESAGDGYDERLVWSIASASPGNGIRPPVTLGVVPAGAELDYGGAPFIAGEIYTVVVERADPRATGDGFTSTAHRYVGRATFRFPSSTHLTPGDDR